MQPGEILAGRYELHEVVGRGGMGEVFRATDRALGREVAVKVLPRHLLGDERATVRFRREAQLAASLHHPNTVTVHDVVSVEGVEAIVMELVDAPTLKDVIDDTGPLPWERALRIAAGVADGLHAAHARGLVHRDVKPSNVLITRDDTVKVTDFGIARTVESSQTVTGTVYGSVPYLAPEQALGDPTDARTDVYGLGCLLYEMLTGRPPYVADDAVGTVYQHLHARPEPPSEHEPDVPGFVDDIVLAALERDASARYPSAAEFAAVLRDGAEGRGPTRRLPPGPVADPQPAMATGPPRRGGRARREAVRRSQPRRSVVPLLVALVVLIFFILWLAGAFEEERSSAIEERPAEAAATSRGSNVPATSAAPTTPPSPSPPATEPSPATTPADDPSGGEPPADVDAAARDVRAAIADARSSGDLGEQTEEELEKRLSEALREHGKGDGDKAIEKLAELRKELRAAVEKGQATELAVERIEPEVDDLEAAIRA